MKISLVILDRDGVINVNRNDHVKSLDELSLIQGAMPSIARLCHRKIPVVVATNQSGIARGFLTPRELDRIHAHMNAELGKYGGHISRFYVAPDDPDRPSDRRKPGAGMLFEAMQDFGVLPGETVMVGDHLKDMEAATRANCHRILVQTGHGLEASQNPKRKQFEPMVIVPDLPAAIQQIERWME